MICSGGLAILQQGGSRKGLAGRWERGMRGGWAPDPPARQVVKIGARGVVHATYMLSRRSWGAPICNGTGSRDCGGIM